MYWLSQSSGMERALKKWAFLVRAFSSDWHCWMQTHRVTRGRAQSFQCAWQQCESQKGAGLPQRVPELSLHQTQLPHVVVAKKNSNLGTQNSSFKEQNLLMNYGNPSSVHIKSADTGTVNPNKLPAAEVNMGTSLKTPWCFLAKPKRHNIIRRADSCV